MSKRSSPDAFPRIAKDFYQTIDPMAVAPLLPFLTPNDTYAEPCYGEGALEYWLGLTGARCNWRSDIESRHAGIHEIDGVALTEEDVKDCDYIITNPPWSRPILHVLIEHFSTLKPTWLLFDADWMHTKQSSELMKARCEVVVSVGRVKWIPNTTMSGKDNCAWYKFNYNKTKDTIFYGR